MNNPFEALDTRLGNIENMLLEIKDCSAKAVNQTETDELLTVQDAAKLLRLSVPTVYGLISRGEIPVMKRSKRCYFSKVELMDYLKQGRKRTNREIAEAAHTHLTSKG